MTIIHVIPQTNIIPNSLYITNTSTYYYKHHYIHELVYMKP